jgi:hypothetical protein
MWNYLCRLEYIPLVVTTSTLTPNEKKSVKQNITMLGGHIVSNWQDSVTHVTMCSLTLTVKVGLSKHCYWYGEPSVCSSHVVSWPVKICWGTNTRSAYLPHTVRTRSVNEIQRNLVKLKLYNLKFLSILNFSLNLHPKEEKLLQIYLIISKTLKIRNSKEKCVL